MTDVNPTLSVITLNVNALNIPIKRKGLAEWSVEKHAPTIYCL